MNDRDPESKQNTPGIFWKRTSRWLAIGVGVQCFLWLTIGIWSLPYYVPGVIKNDISNLEKVYVQRGEPLPVNQETKYLVLCDRLTSRIGSNGIEDLNNRFSELNAVFVTEEEAATNLQISRTPRRNVDEVCFFIEWNTPLFAHVEYGKRSLSVSSWGTGHRFWFVMGVWVHGGAISNWVS